MLFNAILPAFVAALYVRSVRAIPQVTTALPLGVVPEGAESGDGAVLSGVIIGTGEDGTTYVLTPPTAGPSDVPVTATVVENASGLTANFVASSGDFVQSQSLACSLGDGTAVCTQGVIQVSGTLTASALTTITGVPDIATLILSTSSGSAPESTSGSDSSPDATTSPRPSAAKKLSVTTTFVNAVMLAVGLIVVA